MPEQTFEDLQNSGAQQGSGESRNDQGSDQGEQHSGVSPVNVGNRERAASVLIGSVVTLLGIRRRSNFGALLTIVGGGLVYRGMTGYCALSARVGRDTAHGGEPASPEEYNEHGVHVEQATTINKSPEELYKFWRNFENLPQFMSHLKAVHTIDEKKSHWECKAPAGYTVKWDAEIINDVPNSLIAWRSLGDADVANTGSVRFTPADNGQGTDVRVVLEYLPPAGQVGRWLAKMFGEEPDQQVRDDLNKFKQVMEASGAETASAHA